MAILESRPYRTALRTSARAAIHVVDPDCSLEEVSESWHPGAPLRIAVDVEISESFWRETGLERRETVTLVATAACLPARAAWRGTAAVPPAGRGEPVRAVIDVDGEAVAGELLVDAWLTGTGRTFASGPREAFHPGAKLWQLESTVRVPLTDARSAFPTAVLSFRRSQRPAVPWVVETALDAEPAWTVDASMRLCLNSDVSSSTRIAAGTAEEHIYALIRAEIRAAAVHRIADCAELVTADQLDALALEIPESLAALACQSAAAMGLSTGEAIKMAKEDPMLLAAYARESTKFYRGEGVS